MIREYFRTLSCKSQRTSFLNWQCHFCYCSWIKYRQPYLTDMFDCSVFFVPLVCNFISNVYGLFRPIITNRDTAKSCNFVSGNVHSWFSPVSWPIKDMGQYCGRRWHDWEKSRWRCLDKCWCQALGCLSLCYVDILSCLLIYNINFGQNCVMIEWLFYKQS